MQKAAILDRALSNTIIADFLRRNNYLVRFSNSVIRYTCIFPSSGVAFLIVFNDQLSPPLDNENDQKLLNDIHKFYKLHKTCYVILEQQQDKLKDRHFEVELIHSLQRKYLCDRLQFIPVPNIKTVVQVMMNIDKLRSKSSVDILSQRFKNFVSSVIGNTNMVQTLLSTSLTESQINWVQDDVGSLRNLVAMRSQDLLDFGLSSETVSKIISFFT